MALAREVLEDPAYETASADVFDALDVKELRLTGDGVRTVAAMMREGPWKSTRVAIVAKTGAVFGMGRMYELLRHDIEVAVFEDRAAAAERIHAPPRSARVTSG